MGIWDTKKIYGNDLAMDIKPEVQAVFSMITPEEGTEKILSFYKDINEDEKYVLWFVIGDILWDHGILNEDIRNNVNKAIEYAETLDKDCCYSSETIAEFKKKVNSAQPQSKKIRRPKVTHSEWNEGDLLAYRLVNPKFIPEKYDIYGKYMLFHVVSVWRLDVSRILGSALYDEYNTIMIFNWVGDFNDIDKLDIANLQYLPVRIQKRSNMDDIVYLKGSLNNKTPKNTVRDIKKIGNIGKYKGGLNELKNGGSIQQLEINLSYLEKDGYIIKNHTFVKELL